MAHTLPEYGISTTFVDPDEEGSFEKVGQLCRGDDRAQCGDGARTGKVRCLDLRGTQCNGSELGGLRVNFNVDLHGSGRCPALHCFVHGLPLDVLANGFAAMIDVPGLNYRAHRYPC